MLRSYGRGDGSDDWSCVAALGEDDYAHGAGNGIGGSVEAEGVRTGGEIFEAADALQSSYDACVLKVVAAVFAAFYVGGVYGIDKRGVKVTFV
jgi:hypothetical protein